MISHTDSQDRKSGTWHTQRRSIQAGSFSVLLFTPSHPRCHFETPLVIDFTINAVRETDASMSTSELGNIGGALVGQTTTRRLPATRDVLVYLFVREVETQCTSSPMQLVLPKTNTPWVSKSHRVETKVEAAHSLGICDSGKSKEERTIEVNKPTMTLTYRKNPLVIWKTPRGRHMLPPGPLIEYGGMIR